MAETFRPPKAVVAEAFGALCATSALIRSGIPLEFDHVVTMRSEWQGNQGIEWAERIVAQTSERAAAVVEGSSTMTEPPTDAMDTPVVFGENAYGMANSIMAADASIDAAQTLLEQIKDVDPIAAQAYYLLVAADASLDPVIDMLGLEDPDEEIAEDGGVINAPDDETNEPDDAMRAAEDVDSEERASAARIGVGTFVSWQSSADRAQGKVEKVVSKGPAESSDGYVLEATPDFPVFVIRVWNKNGNGYSPSETTVVHRNDNLNVIGALAAPREADLDLVESRKSAIATAERVTMDAEVRTVATDDGSLRIAGYAATFNQEATGLNFREMIAPGAFTRSLQSSDPVFLLVNHDTEALPLASTQSGTLRLTQDNVGLRMEADLDPMNPRAAELASVLSRGDVDKMSFAFTVNPDGETRSEGLRTLTDLNLYEVSVVTYPAYDSTSVGMRNADAELEDLEMRRRLIAARIAHTNLR
jgi:HK97 family phage prohead protease